jgi:hypothetical protein
MAFGLFLLPVDPGAICVLYASVTWTVADIHRAEKTVEKLFKVQLTHLESRNFLSRPTHEQLIQERERVLMREMSQLSDRVPRLAQPDTGVVSPSLDPGTLPAWIDEETEDCLKTIG